MIAELKKHWKIIGGVAAFILCLAIIIFGTGGDSESESNPRRPVNIFLTDDIFNTTSEEIESYGFYTSTGNIIITVEKISGFEGSVTLSDGESEKTVQISGKQDSYTFSDLSTEIPYTIICDGMENCTITIKKFTSDGE